MRLLALLLSVLLAACSTSSKKPTTHTSVPSLDVSRERVKQLRSSIQDSKDGIRRVRSLQERIDYKESMLK